MQGQSQKQTTGPRLCYKHILAPAQHKVNRSAKNLNFAINKVSFFALRKKKIKIRKFFKKGIDNYLTKC